MSQENAEIVRELFEAAFVRHDRRLLEAPLPPTVHPEIEIDWSNSRRPERGVYPFRQAIRLLYQDGETWEEWRVDAEQMIGDGDRVVVETHMRARGRGSGVDVEARGAQVWTVRDGQITRIKNYQSLADALGAVHLTQ